MHKFLLLQGLWEEQKKDFFFFEEQKKRVIHKSKSWEQIHITSRLSQLKFG